MSDLSARLDQLADALDALRQRLAAAENELSAQERIATAWRERAEGAEAENERLREAIDDYRVAFEYPPPFSQPAHDEWLVRFQAANDALSAALASADGPAGKGDNEKKTS